MANLSIISSPPQIALIDEGINFQFERTVLPVPVSANLLLQFVNDDSVYLNKYFEILFGGNNYKFYFKTTPNESGLQLNNWISGNTFDQFLIAVASDLQQNFMLNADYTVLAVAGSGIRLTARKTGTAHNLSYVGSDIALEAFNTLGFDDTTPTDYRIYAAICKKENLQDLSIPLGEDFLPLDGNNIAASDFAEYLKDQLKSSYHFPFIGTLIFPVENAVINYFIRYTDFFDGAMQKVYNTFLASKYAIAGGLKKIDSDYLKSENTSFFDMTPERFLSWAPLSKLTHLDTPERLYFLTQSTGLKLMAKMYFSASETELEISAISADAFTIIEILCGVPEIFNNIDISDLQAYDVWIAADNEISEIRHFEIDQQDYLNKRTLVFRNSFDKYDMLHCTGNLSITDNITREEVEVLTNDTFRKQILSAENSAKYSLASGWLNDKETRLWLEDLLLSGEISLIIGDVLFPIIVKTSEARKQKDKEYLYQILIEFVPDYADKRYSNIVDDGIFVLTDEEGNILTDENDLLIQQ